MVAPATTPTIPPRICYAFARSADRNFIVGGMAGCDRRLTDKDDCDRRLTVNGIMILSKGR
jgi:hypothetical protein